MSREPGAGDGSALSARYEVKRELGRGGMAVVYLARDRELGREVAVKILNPAGGLDAEAVERFEREGRVAAQLEHPHIVPVYNIHRLGDDRLALVMRYIRGHTLAEEVESKGPMSPERAADVLDQVAQALSYAHSRNVVHRDVKPANIFLDENGRALLGDFGVAKATHETTRLTRTNVSVGTPNYMAPEEIDDGSSDHRSDIYSLGLVGWACLTGERPWGDADSLYSVIYRQKNERLPDVERYRDDVGPALLDAVRGAQRKDPERRWQSAEDFRSALAAGEATPAPSAGGGFGTGGGGQSVADIGPADRPLAWAAVGLLVVGAGGWMIWNGGTAGIGDLRGAAELAELESKIERALGAGRADAAYRLIRRYERMGGSTPALARWRERAGKLETGDSSADEPARRAGAADTGTGRATARTGPDRDVATGTLDPSEASTQDTGPPSGDPPRDTGIPAEGEKVAASDTPAARSDTLSRAGTGEARPARAGGAQPSVAGGASGQSRTQDTSRRDEPAPSTVTIAANGASEVEVMPLGGGGAARSGSGGDTLQVSPGRYRFTVVAADGRRWTDERRLEEGVSYRIEPKFRNRTEAALSAAREYMRIGETDQAVEALGTYLERGGTAGPVDSLATRMMANGEFSAAAEAYRYLSGRQPGNIAVEAKLERARSLERVSTTVDVPAGVTIVGGKPARSYRRRTEIEVDGFRIDKYEVTNIEYARFVSETGHPAPATWQGGEYPSGKALHPVLGVTLADARAYCEWVGGRLPTDEEWDRAARGDESYSYPWGNTFNPDFVVAGTNETSPVTSHPQGASPWGIHHMVGNAAEITRNGLTRGGSFRSPELAGMLRIARYETAESGGAGTGFRCVR